MLNGLLRRLLGGENRPLVTYATGGYYRQARASNEDCCTELARFVDQRLPGGQVEDRRWRCRPGGGTKSLRCGRRSATGST